MPKFHLHIVNSDFESSNEIDAPDINAARQSALRGALAIGVDEICKGVPFFGAEIRVEFDDELKERFLVGIGQTPLK